MSILNHLKHYAGVAKLSWQSRKQLASRPVTPTEAEFLPAALALQEQPVSPAPRIAMWLIVSFFIIALLWAYFGKIDITATAQGKIIPSDRTKVIQPFETATVKQILVKEGQAVKAGQVLVALDYTVAQADNTKTSSDLAFARLKAYRAKYILAKLAGLALPSIDHHNINPDLFNESHSALLSQLNEYQSRLSTYDAEISRRQAELNSSTAQVTNLEKIVPIAKTRADDFKQLKDENYASRHEYLAYEQARLEKETELDRQRGQVKELSAALNETRTQRAQFMAEFRKSTMDSLNEAQQQIETLEQEGIKTAQRQALTALKSPVDGTVQQLAINTVGGVVTPAQALMVIVPKNNPLEVEAFIPNKDIGFVREDQNAEVKIETFPHSRYGTIDAKVLSISHDAINDEKLGLIYSSLIRMEKSTINVDGKQVNLSPGMAVTVEIKTGQRRLIEYFLSPLIQNAKDSLHER
ncbi:HlyD family type I secretion periplasmic adaptor subunit [Alkanindiges illinoisensis]|uniref:HlyD family type I secretion periplasmic adaptor subunit n=1 Tax=Alkanindiges illinoisensis TaxID=197183 RepID=UPI00047C5388|nr:HlyD family type I secretion periplasmic adaptor subunit [Alkanindiges illinoisensis]